VKYTNSFGICTSTVPVSPAAVGVARIEVTGVTPAYKEVRVVKAGGKRMTTVPVALGAVGVAIVAVIGVEPV
jgi:hypothetical protein